MEAAFLKQTKADYQQISETQFSHLYNTIKHRSEHFKSKYWAQWAPPLFYKVAIILQYYSPSNRQDKLGASLNPATPG